MQVAPQVPFHLTYCTNIHAADGWSAVFGNVRQFATTLKQRLSPSAPFGIGLRLSARDARELLHDDGIGEFRRFLEAQGLYVALINGFPHGSFHRTPVKAEVYAPDWRDDERVRYTLDLVNILERLLPRDMDGGISTAPLSYKPWVAEGDTRPFVRNVVQVVAAMARSKQHTGATLHLDIEPEPDCVIETSDEFVEFFTRRVIADGAPLLAAALGCDVDDARASLYEHVRICVDCCHFAVEYEDPRAALDHIRDAGIQIGRVQLSSALKVMFPRDETACAGMIERLRRFADATYLHQVIERRGGALSHFPDLDVALDRSSSLAGAEWRIHFHVPLFASDYEGLESTQDYVREVLDLARRTRFAHHFEIETYTWDVLPAGLKIDLLDSIEREYRWVLANFV